MSHLPFSAPEDLLRFDDACRRFEIACKAGQSPGIEGELAEWPEIVRCHIFEELLHLELHYLQGGTSQGMAEYQRRFPEYASQIAKAFQEFKQSPNHQNRKMEQTITGPEPEVAQAIPERINRYKIERVLGKGGFGLVYLAYDEQLKRPVAIKVPHHKLVDRPEDAAAYLTEARTVANLDHPHIVPVYDVGSTETFPCFIVSKYIEGHTLGQKLKDDRPTFGQATELVATIAEALHYAHRKGLVHRDIKPGNILIDTNGKPNVADFGLALKEEDFGKGAGFAGTPLT
jgi:predicted Ser/Thr protein kinase